MKHTVRVNRDNLEKNIRQAKLPPVEFKPPHERLAVWLSGFIVLLCLTNILTFAQSLNFRDELNSCEKLYNTEAKADTELFRANIELKRALVATSRENNALYRTQHELQKELADQ